MSEFAPHRWTPISDLPADWQTSMLNTQTTALVAAWQEQQEELRAKGVFTAFVDKLKRQWSIETGIIEGAYSLSEGATKTLIEKGLDAALISHSDANEEPSSIIAKIHDHKLAIDGLYDFVSGNRELTLSYIKELHVVLMNNQRTYVARDSLGNWVDRELPRGIWKKMPNNVEHPDAGVFEYCPPEQVQQEMENLLSMHNMHVVSNVPADVEAAWLHHRFSVIHPFTDGNGRVVRCLATLVMLKSRWLPLVVTRTERDEYIRSLRSADGGSLKELVDLFGSLQRKSIREAISLGEQAAQESKAFDTILRAVTAKFSQRKQADVERRRRAVAIADSLFQVTNDSMRSKAESIATAIKEANPQFSAFLAIGANGSEKGTYYYKQIVECARHFQYYANLHVYHAWSTLVLKTDRRSEVLVSIHGIGGGESGIYGCTAAFFTKDRQEDETQISDFIPLGSEPFEFSYTEDGTEVQRRFIRWLDGVVMLGMQEWQKSV